MDKINQRIATELSVGVLQVAAAVELLGEGATVPFIARYRKERTGSLDDTQLRRLKERLEYLRGLEDRRATVLRSIEEQGKLTADLARAIGDADTSSRRRPGWSRWPTRSSPIPRCRSMRRRRSSSMAKRASPMPRPRWTGRATS